jgi:phage shock protein PspC (stress-responsive transcriptional regulator)
MKKTLSINIAGIVFHIEEDAFAILDAYLKSIHAYFKNFEGAKDIVDDIEARIAEKFWNIRETEKTEAITQVHVDALIASLGTIADFQEIEAEDDKKEQTFNSAPKSGFSRPFRRDLSNKKLGGVAAGMANYFEIDPIVVRLIMVVAFFGLIPLLHMANFIFWAYIICWVAIPGEVILASKTYRKFFRDRENKVIGGVMAGIAAYTGWDVGILRVLAVISLFFFGAGAAAYIFILVITPEAKSLTDKMEMTGEPITLENIERNIKETIQPESSEEKPITRILLFPFRALATIFSAIKPLLVVVRWFFQYLLGIILLIVGVAFMVGLVVLTTAGISGFDHGQVDIAFGVAVPVFLLAQDLPVWAVYAAYAAFIPIILGIGISGISLLANRKLTNKTYKITATSIVIIGWIGLVAAFSMVGRNFQRTASVNHMKEISVDSSFILDVKRESQESIWEKMLGNTILADEFLNDEDLHDFNRDGFSRATLSLEGYEGKKIQVIQFSKSNGKTRLEAELNAKSIQYQYQIKGDKITFDSHFGLKNLKFRNQKMRIKILIPYGYMFGMSREFAQYIENRIDGGYFSNEESDLFLGSKWTFSMDRGLVCLNREPLSNNNSDDSDQENSDFPKDSFVPKSKDSLNQGDSDLNIGFSINKTLPSFSSIEMLKSETAAMSITQGPEFQITYKSSNPMDDFSSLAKVDQGVLKFPKVQSGLEIMIQMPSLKKLNLGGNSKTTLNGFNLDKLDIVLSGFHSLTLAGKSKLLQVSANESSELLAANWLTQKAFVAVSNQAKMELNASELIKGLKGERSDVTYKSYPKLNVQWKINKN